MSCWASFYSLWWRLTLTSQWLTISLRLLESVGGHKYIFTFYEIVAKTPPTIEINKDKWLKIDMKDLYLFDRYVLILLSEVCYMQ